MDYSIEEAQEVCDKIDAAITEVLGVSDDSV